MDDRIEMLGLTGVTVPRWLVERSQHGLNANQLTLERVVTTRVTPGMMAAVLLGHPEVTMPLSMALGIVRAVTAAAEAEAHVREEPRRCDRCGQLWQEADYRRGQLDALRTLASGMRKALDGETLDAVAAAIRTALDQNAGQR